jgi:hypothetical protein
VRTAQGPEDYEQCYAVKNTQRCWMNATSVASDGLFDLAPLCRAAGDEYVIQDGERTRKDSHRKPERYM